MKNSQFYKLKKSASKIKFIPFERMEYMFNMLKQRNEVAYYRRGSLADELIIDGLRIYYYRGSKSIFKYGWLFREVKKQAQEFVNNNKIKPKKKYLAILLNKKYVFQKGETIEKNIVGFDIDDAFWNIAFKMGVINERTFRTGLELPNEVKSIKLASLANLSSDKHFSIIQNGEVNQRKKMVVIPCNPLTKIVYQNIRDTCLEYMFKLSKLLKDDFYEYRVDAIYFRKSAQSIKLVKDYFKNLNVSVSRLYWE
jgi:hypothetical protein